MDPTRLRSSPLFDGISDDDLGRCADLFQEAEILQGSGLTKQDDFAYKFFVVLDGEVEVLRDFEHVARLGPGEFFGEMALMSGETRNARIVAHSRCDVAWMMAWDFKTMSEEFPEIAGRIESTVAERMASVPEGDD